jgi:hypothetical protein
MTKVGHNCSCAHPVDPHVLVAMESGVVADVPNVPVSGVMLCPSCECAATWSVMGYPEPPLPAPEILDEIRRMIRAEARLWAAAS